METKRRPPIAGGFKVLIVPADDVEGLDLTVPMTYRPTRDTIRVVGEAYGHGNVGCSPWAFTRASRRMTVRNLRELADWLEQKECI